MDFTGPLRFTNKAEQPEGTDSSGLLREHLYSTKAIKQLQ